MRALIKVTASIYEIKLFYTSQTLIFGFIYTGFTPFKAWHAKIIGSVAKTKEGIRTCWFASLSKQKKSYCTFWTFFLSRTRAFYAIFMTYWAISQSILTDEIAIRTILKVAAIVQKVIVRIAFSAFIWIVWLIAFQTSGMTFFTSFCRCYSYIFYRAHWVTGSIKEKITSDATSARCIGRVFASLTLWGT